MKLLPLVRTLTLPISLLLLSSCNDSFKFTRGASIGQNNSTNLSLNTFTERSYSKATKLADGNVLVVGGENGDEVLALVDLYNPVTNMISSVAPLIEARSFHTATLLQNGKVLVTGGYTGLNWDPTATAEIFDTTLKTWTAVPSMSVERAYHTATLLQDGKVLVTGGYDFNWDYLDSSEIYDPLLNTWTPASQMNEFRATHTATLTASGRVVVIGGESDFGNLNNAEVYNPANNSWTPLSNMALGRAYHTANLLPSGDILIIGGYDENWNLVNNADIYNISLDSWSAAPPMSTERRDHTSTSLQDGKIVVIGGRTNSGTTNSIETYDPVANSWSNSGSLLEARESHASSSVLNNKVVIFGGYANSSYLSTVELYNSTLNSSSSVAYPTPKITSVSSPSNSIYFTGNAVNFLVTFTESVIITGSPRLTIDVGGVSRYAYATTHSASTTHNFRYVVGSSDFDDDGIEVNALASLNGGTIKSTSSKVNANLTLVPPVTDGININQDAPFVSSITPPASGTYRVGYNLDFTLTFSESVTISGQPRFPIMLEGFQFYAKALTQGNATSHIFRFIGTQGYEDSNGIEISGPIELNGGSILRTSDNMPAFLYLPYVNTSGVLTANRAEMNLVRYNHTEIILNNGFILAAGGLESPANIITDTVEIYNPTLDTWTTVAPLNTPRAAHNAALLNDGRVIIAGGTDYVAAPAYAAYDSVEIYDPVANTWTVKAPMNGGRFDSTSVLLADGRFMVTGGRGAMFSFLDSVEIYDPMLDSWTLKAPLTGGPQAQHLAILMLNGNVFITGGYNNGVPTPNEVIDPNL